MSVGGESGAKKVVERGKKRADEAEGEREEDEEKGRKRWKGGEGVKKVEAARVGRREREDMEEDRRGKGVIKGRRKRT